jgi:hypothetical protein
VDTGPDHVIADVRRYAALGVSQLNLTPDGDPVVYTERVAEMVPRLADL